LPAAFPRFDKSDERLALVTQALMLLKYEPPSPPAIEAAQSEREIPPDLTGRRVRLVFVSYRPQIRAKAKGFKLIPIAEGI
jgi:hypothetical protein